MVSAHGTAQAEGVGWKSMRGKAFRVRRGVLGELWALAIALLGGPLFGHTQPGR